MKFPCELIVKNFLPAIRYRISKQMSKSFNQEEIAKRLGVTQSLISLYLSDKINVNPEISKRLEDFDDELENISKVSEIEFIMSICRICRTLRSDDVLCNLHKEIDPSLSECSICSRPKDLELDRLHVIENLKRAFEILRKTDNIVDLVPEVFINLVMAVPNPKSIFDVAGFPGRIVKSGNEIKTLEGPKFGASTHMANILLTTMKIDNSKRSCINIRYSDEILDICKKIKLSIVRIENRFQSKDLDEKLSKNIENVLEKEVPDVLYDLGDVGVEPILYIFASSAIEAAGIVQRIGSMINML
ncbi:MAG: thiamine-phosphate synthase family protein [Candidatus Hydrothermarchaeota archaeon]